MFSSQALSLLLAASTLVRGTPVVTRDNSNNCASGLIAALEQPDLEASISAHLLGDAVESSGGSYLCDLFSSQAITLFVPQNKAYDPDHPSVGDDPVGVWSYSTVFGTPEDGFKVTNTSLTRKGAAQSRSSASSGLQWPARSSRKRAGGLLDNNQVQIIDQISSSSKKRWNDGPLYIVDRPVGSALVLKRASYKNVVIMVIDRLLTKPTTVSDLLCKPLVSSAPYGFTKFGGGLQKAGLLDYVDQGFKSTVFVPTDQAFYDSDCSNDDVSTLKNHFFFGKIVYSTIFPYVSQATAESGKELYFSYEDGIHYVQCGSTKAIILRSDVTSKWGVTHVIDKVLKC
ncbi:hypothetical protein FS749_012329 [Ceratobasidium sp. UAMH 11750]|nr:hypothetical protein FS749_012329 [Ceratobasidium sp. UAMH 11750]